MIFISVIVMVVGWSNDYWLESGQVMSRIEQSSLIYGFKLFVLSEFFLFVSAFGSFINLRLNLSNFGLYSLFPLFTTMVFSLPTSNLFILVTSGFPLSSSQIISKMGDFESFALGIIQTLSASLLFIALQLKEFIYSLFSFYDSVLGSIFYFTVGTHGSHVIVGSILIYFSFILSILNSDRDWKEEEDMDWEEEDSSDSANESRYRQGIHKVNLSNLTYMQYLAVLSKARSADIPIKILSKTDSNSTIHSSFFINLSCSKLDYLELCKFFHSQNIAPFNDMDYLFS